VRGSQIGIIFQEPMTSLNPIFSIGDQLMEVIRAHERIGRKTQRDRAVEMLDRVGIAAAGQRLGDYPHQLSGGMRQRVMIAIALACNPSLLIADEPTTALDVTIQRQILDLLLELRHQFGMAILLITHNMGVVAQIADRVAVMYSGKIMEQAPSAALFARPAHPYTQALLESIPSLSQERRRLRTISGSLPDPRALPSGCRFEPRCPRRIEDCSHSVPPFANIEKDHEAACIRVGEGAAR
jgi:oligopeptide/dipeptide ABC transporter ATP-binding protein